MKKLYCYDCDKEQNVIVRQEQVEYEFRGKKYTIQEKNYYCPNCSNLLIDNHDNFMEKIYEQYLHDYDLSFEKIKNIRKKYNLSQELFAKLLLWSKKTVVRYENAQSVPQGEYLSMYCRLMKQPDEIFSILERNQSQISEKDYQQIVQLPYFKIYKSIHLILYFIKDTSLYMTQIMKHLFACDMLSIQKNNHSISNFVYCALPYGPVIDQYKAFFEFLISNNYTDFDFDDDIDKPKYIAHLPFNSNLFTKEELECMKYVKNALKGKSAKQLSNWSHQFNAWSKTEIGEKMDLKKYINDFNI